MKCDKKIANLLKKQVSPQDIFKKIQHDDEPNQVACFLYNCGLYETLLKFCIQQIEQNKPCPWPYLLKLFLKHKFKIDKHLEQIIFHYWLKHKTNQSPSLFACSEWGDVSLSFQQMQLVYIQELKDQEFSKHKILLEKLEFARSQKLFKDEQEILDQLQAIKPDDIQYKKLKKQLEEREALDLISKQKIPTDKTKSLDYKQELLQGEQDLKDLWYQQASKLTQTEPKNVKNLAIFFAFCTWPDASIKVMDKHPEACAHYWFYLDWILETKQYEKGLYVIDRLLKDPQNQEIYLMPLTYIKAKILHATGKKKQAIEDLIAISQVQFNYRNVQYLLKEWQTNKD